MIEFNPSVFELLILISPPYSLLLLFGNFQSGSSLQQLVLLRLRKKQPVKTENIFSCENWTRSHSHQIFVELLKVAGNDGDGEGHDQHPADGTHTPHQL